MDTYYVKRVYQMDHPSRVLKEGLTLEEAQTHCKDPETSSRTCTEEASKKHTEQYGAWYDVYEKE